MNKEILIYAILFAFLISSVTAASNTTSKMGIGSEENMSNSVSDTPDIVFFYSPTCPHCSKLDEHLQSLDSSKFTLKKYKASTNSEKFSAYIQNHSVPASYAGAVPTVFIDDDYAVGSKKAMNLIRESLNQNPETVQQTNEADKEQEGAISNLGVLGLIGLAVTDSINPCALAVLLILIGSIMSSNLDNQIKALKSGASFTAGIFVSYFLMGVLLVFGIKSVQKATTLNINGIYMFFGGFAVLIGLLNLKDWYSHGLGGFAMEVPFSWRPKMKSYLKRVTGPVGAFITAILVSLFLLPCTSGPYFVAGGLLSKTAWNLAIPLLLLYNIVFIAPMLLIIATLYFGATEVEKVKEFRKENIESLHLIAGIILIALGLFLLLDAGIISQITSFFI